MKDREIIDTIKEEIIIDRIKEEIYKEKKEKTEELNEKISLFVFGFCVALIILAIIEGIIRFCSI